MSGLGHGYIRSSAWLSKKGDTGACAVCRTDLHILDGELSPQKLPLIPGHEIVGTVVERGERVSRLGISGWAGRRQGQQGRLSRSS